MNAHNNNLIQIYTSKRVAIHIFFNSTDLFRINETVDSSDSISSFVWMQKTVTGRTEKKFVKQRLEECGLFLESHLFSCSTHQLMVSRHKKWYLLPLPFQTRFSHAHSLQCACRWQAPNQCLMT